MTKRDDLHIFYDLIFDSINEIEDEANFPTFFYNAFLAGLNTIYQKKITETKSFDDDWIYTLESYFPSIDKIIKNPKSNLKYEEEIIAIEKAKKTNSASIRHLASHTHFIKEIRKDNIIPKKILTQNPETEFEIYENRFIKTLINRLYTFVNGRYEVIKSNYESFQKHHVNFQSKFKFDNSDVDLALDLNIKRDLEDQTINQHNLELLNRVEYLTNLIGGFKTSTFMKQMEKARNVVPPIMKTNIILRNSDFKNAYNLWLFLDRYTSIGFDIDVKEMNIDVNKSFLKDIYQLSLLTYTTIQHNQRAKKQRFEDNDLITYKRKNTKVAKTNAKDIVENPDAIAVEDSAINEYYLNQNKKIFRKKIDDLVNENNNYDLALKKAMRETIDITNALYKSFFELENNEEDEDFFSKMVTKIDLDEDLDSAKTRAKIARLIRETKEVDYNDSIRLEKRLLKEIESLNNQIIRREKVRMKEEIEEVKRQEIEKKIAYIQQLKNKAKKNQKVLEKVAADSSKLKSNITGEQSKISAKIRSDSSDLNKQKKELISKEKEKVKTQTAKEVKNLKEKEKQTQEKEKIKLILKNIKEKEKAKLKLEKEINIEKSKLTRLEEKNKPKKIKSKPLAKKITNVDDDLTKEQRINQQVDSLLKKAKEKPSPKLVNDLNN